MNEAELTVIDDTSTDNEVVEHFVQTSRDLVPSLEVTLAKRIIKPGSNRMLCLAAHTSVPLRDDEIASVSNLALRLSDGTNVALSLSFFNDSEVSANFTPQYATAGAPAYVMQPPLNRYYYDPGRFCADRDSRMGAYLVAATILLATGFYAYLHSQARPLSFSLAGLQRFWPVNSASQPARPGHHPASVTHSKGASESVTATKKSAATLQTSAPAKRNASGDISVKAKQHQQEKASVRTDSLARQKSTASHAKASANPARAATHASDQMLVPPPPPMTPVDLAPYGSFPAWDFHVPMTSSANQLRPQAATPPTKQKPEVQVSKPVQAPAQVSSPAVVQRTSPVHSNGAAISPALKSSARTAAPASSSTAYAYESLHLERIVPPDQQ